MENGQKQSAHFFFLKPSIVLASLSCISNLVAYMSSHSPFMQKYIFKIVLTSPDSSVQYKISLFQSFVNSNKLVLSRHLYIFFIFGMCLYGNALRNKSNLLTLLLPILPSILAQSVSIRT